MFGSAPAFFTVFEIIFAVVFIAVFAVIIISVKRTITEKKTNASLPRISAAVMVVGKRSSMSGGGESSVRTRYFVTFQFDSGDRLELAVNSEAYGLIAESDYGNLTFRGTEFIGFERK